MSSQAHTLFDLINFKKALIEKKRDFVSIDIISKLNSKIRHFCYCCSK